MDKLDYVFMQAVKSSFKFEPKIVELGSRCIGDQAKFSARLVFGNGLDSNEYVGVDYVEGEGVDLVHDVTKLPFEDNSVNTVIAMNLFEHVEKVWLAMDEIKRILSDDGVVIFATPFCYEIHACPYDFFRYTPFFYNKMFEDLDVRITATRGYKIRPTMVYFIASNNKDFLERYELFSDSYKKLHSQNLKPFSKIKSYIRKFFSPNHFKNDIKYQHTLDIEISTNPLDEK